ncbi:IS110 family transposase [Streptomyces olivochromogenes]|uniref:IS110 family transposase n=1 Tax=Streptomyces olivochromogenes TaxID=1963 RepID=UPI001F31896A|nr:IS110 family transposase [Streptomyces olivochromogenes]
MRRPPPRCAGSAPVERSSGSRQYRRLNRGGDRQANAALHRMVQTRCASTPAPGSTTSVASPRARRGAGSSGPSDASSRERSFT